MIFGPVDTGTKKFIKGKFMCADLPSTTREY
jgi:hypothetical protein